MVVFESYQGFTSGIISKLLEIFVPIVIFYMLHKTKPGARKFIFILFFIFMGMITYGIYEEFKISEKVEYAFKHKTYLVAEGIVDKLDPMPKSGHKVESFEVNNVLFEILYTGNYPGEETLLYTLTKNRNGPIQRNGQHVKIYYIPHDGTNKIIKMWVYD